MKIPTVCMFLDANRYSCVRVSEGSKLTHYIAIPEGNEPFSLLNMSNDRFAARYVKPEPDYPLSRVADHYLAMAGTRGATDKVRSILSMLKKESNVSAQEAKVNTEEKSPTPNWAGQPGGDTKPAKKKAAAGKPKANGAKKPAAKEKAPAKKKAAAEKPAKKSLKDFKDQLSGKGGGAAPKKKAAAKGSAKTERARYAEDQKFKVEVDNTRDGTHMKTMMEAAVELKKFTRAELLNKIERRLDKDSPGRSARFFSWALGHGLFVTV